VSTGSRAAVFLDRDGVLNQPVLVDGRPHPPAGVEDLALLPGVKDACDELHDAGYLLLVVSNQPDVARGTLSMSAVETINRSLSEQLPLDGVYVCPHDDTDGCDCRKPKPGLLLQAASRWNVDMQRSFMVGDRWRDVDAGMSAGCATVFIDRDYSEPRPRQFDIAVRDLPEAATWILRRTP
jgi:D-glycero-D-manno-heptose 1,7-bisphosphate phosphatase